MIFVAAVVVTGCAGTRGTVVEDEGLPTVPSTHGANQAGPASAAEPTSADAWLRESIPNGARGDTVESAAVMAQFYLTLLPGVFQGADRGLFEGLMTPDCVYCNTMLAQAKQNLDRDLVLVGGQFSVDLASVQVGTVGPGTDADADTGTIRVTFAAEREPHQVRHGADDARTAHPPIEWEATEWEVTMWLVHRDGLWRIREISMRPRYVILG